MSDSKELLSWRELEVGCIVTEAGSASRYKTGDWRSQRPIFNYDKCTDCGLCYVYCPEGCVRLNADGRFEPDLFYCKGCGICARECPSGAITIIEEEE